MSGSNCSPIFLIYQAVQRFQTCRYTGMNWLRLRNLCTNSILWNLRILSTILKLHSWSTPASKTDDRKNLAVYLWRLCTVKEISIFPCVCFSNCTVHHSYHYYVYKFRMYKYISIGNRTLYNSLQVAVTRVYFCIVRAQFSTAGKFVNWGKPRNFVFLL